MSNEIQPYIFLPPAGPAVPLVCDSPHSGTCYPVDFGHAAPMELLRRCEDTHVESLWSALPDMGATLLAASFPRSYIDPNRALDDLDPELVEGEWPEPLQPGAKTKLGFGLVWRKIDKTTEIYRRKLSAAEVKHRIDRYYRPYHAKLAEAIEESFTRFGAVWHLNLHSMANDSYRRLGIEGAGPLADFVLGDRDGTTCEPEFVALVEELLRSRGYSVARNDPFKGVQLIARIGRPAERRNSLQIEVRRPLYMDEQTRERNSGFAMLQQDLAAVGAILADYVRSRVPAA